MVFLCIEIYNSPKAGTEGVCLVLVSFPSCFFFGGGGLFVWGFLLLIGDFFFWLVGWVFLVCFFECKVRL